MENGTVLSSLQSKQVGASFGWSIPVCVLCWEQGCCLCLLFWDPSVFSSVLTAARRQEGLPKAQSQQESGDQLLRGS